MTEVIRTTINGEPGDRISVRDRGFQYGDGLFETIAVRDGAPRLWSHHLDRLQRGAVQLKLPLPDVTVLQQEAQNLCRDVDRAVLKLIVTRGPATDGYALPDSPQPTYVFSLSAWPPDRESWAEGVAVCVCKTRIATNPKLAGIKHLNRLEQILARAEWRDEYAEGLMLDVDGHVIDGTTSNVFAVFDRGLVTPDVANGGIAGVMRGVVLAHATLLGIPSWVAPLKLDELYAAQEIFLTNSLMGVVPVTQFDGRKFSIGNTTRTLQQRLQEIGVRP